LQLERLSIENNQLSGALADVLGGLPALKRLSLADNGDFDTCEVVPTAAQRAAAPEVWDELIAACSGELELRKV
jgi:hypothetical protein